MLASADLRVTEFPTRSRAGTIVVPWAELMVGCLFGLCLIALTHDTANLTTDAEESVEAGRGMDDIEAFHKNVNSAPLHRKLGFVGLLSLGCFCYATAPRNAQILYNVVLAVAAICFVWLAASFLWSDDWRHTAREFVRVAAYAFVALGMALRFRPRSLCVVIMLALAASVFAACSASVLAGTFRPWASNFRLHGTLHSNLLAHHAIVVLLIAVALVPSSRQVWFWRTMIVAALSVIILSKTRGALASAVVGITVLKLFGRNFWSIATVVSILASLVIAGAMLVVMSSSQVQEKVQEALVLGRSDGLGTLTGRIPLWEAVWEASESRHWQGYGYGAFWSIERTEELSEELEWFPRHAHSAYMHTKLDLGFIGLGLLLLLVFACLYTALRYYRATGDPAYQFFFCFLATGLLDGFVEICFVSPRELGLFVGIMIMGLIVAHPTEANFAEEQN